MKTNKISIIFLLIIFLLLSIGTLGCSKTNPNGEAKDQKVDVIQIMNTDENILSVDISQENDSINLAIKVVESISKESAIELINSYTDLIKEQYRDKNINIQILQGSNIIGGMSIKS